MGEFQIMKIITIPLRDFALPAPRCGSIELHSGYGRSQMEGREIHVRVQKRRMRADSCYQVEVPIRGCFDRGGFRFLVEGRMDGIYHRDPPLIEEIKSGFNIHELAGRLAGSTFEHPYTLQLLTYGYLYYKENAIIPKLSLHLVSSRNGESRDMQMVLDPLRYEEWLVRRLAGLVKEAEIADKRAKRRRRLAKELRFPFPVPRPGQGDLMETVRKGIAERKAMLIQAPTGLGKTMGVMYPILEDAFDHGQRVIYVTPKNSQHALAEDAVNRLHNAGSPIRSLTIMAKGKICLKDEPLCTPEYCEYARDYYTKIEAHGVQEILAKKRSLKARVFRELGERYRICPFELQFEAAEGSDMVICDYNYVFAPRSSAGRLTNAGIGQDGKPSLIIDEVHNLPARAMDYYSPELSTASLERIRGELQNLPPRFKREGEAILDNCILTVSSCGQPSAKAKRIDAPLEQFISMGAVIHGFLARYLESGAEIERNDPVLCLSNYWSEFTASLELAADNEREEFFTTFHPDSTGARIRITCCDASEMLKECYGDYAQVVGFSATLKPFEYYARLSGLDPQRLLTAEFLSPFPKERRKILIIPQISTRYSRRERNYGKIAEAVQRIASLNQGNYFVFLPSFEFLNRVAGLLKTPDGFIVLRQERGMSADRVEATIDHLRGRSVPTIIFAVQGGIFSEGMDYADDTLIGVFVVGPPLPTYDLEREEMRRYYQRRYGSGFEYAYALPAMARTVQAAGRVIRSETDRGLIVLMDDRFLEETYWRSMPADWFEENVSELVSESILKDVAEFWKQLPQ
jgi:DNA excision repair protein ERCC-2